MPHNLKIIIFSPELPPPRTLLLHATVKGMAAADQLLTQYEPDQPLSKDPGKRPKSGHEGLPLKNWLREHALCHGTRSNWQFASPPPQQLFGQLGFNTRGHINNNSC